ncbi:MAG TPA: hypothetical protein PKN95_00215 [Verrucomicrobiota bacterium]|nr:hypothetical protein [Verrucomicrobiota bacterium]HNT14432.1 hypothetical protein [Verrucomicrobiota bacterium]
MNTRSKSRIAAALVLLSTLIPQLSTCLAQGTAFTYQGRLNDGSTPANGIYDLRFTIYDSAGGPGIVAGPLTNSPVAVSNGLFTVTLDPGAGVFTGDPRWLEIAVRASGGGAFTPLTPRQALTATPYAITAGGITGEINGGQILAGTIAGAQLAAGAVQAANIAPGAITAAQLAKPPRSGTVSSGAFAVDFGQGDFVVAFNPAFSNTPVVTLGLQPGYPPTLGEQAALYVKSRSASGFTGRFSSPAAVQKLSEYGVHSSLALLTNGAVALAAQGTPACIQYLRGYSTGTGWSAPLKLLLGRGGQDYIRLAVVNGHPAIAYHSVTGAVQFIRATDVDGTAWGSPTDVVASTSTSFSYVSLAIVNGHPAIAWFESPNWDVKYARATDANGTAWGAPVAVQTAGQVGRTLSLAVVNGAPAISYEDFSAGALKYIRATDADGTAWGAPVTVDATQSWQTSLAVVNGRPAIGYARPAGGTRFVRAADANGAAWGTPVQVGDYGADISLQVVNGRPAMSFISGRLQYVRAADADGTVWNSPALLDPEASAAAGTSLIVLPTGVPAISYYGQFSFAEPSGTLRLVREPQLTFDINWIALEP